ncbi:hypothetical protein CXG81DRAFT_27868 [Caulochytrium protostelioides]|uniref:DUF4211 domain-containing protein n=1 Tax=Caulochytrium protostelioides TaxID=1555241 RepID=A0A4P9X2Y4_9FUNG|nr:hypothetical protein CAUPRSCDRAFT_10275 [Caulochytrium protostelioides]RKO99361.1 hypothetical protein CXG81DRAFT_27868 [Caulochytrium protostelioides]|eukprot:RKO99361.1 hypothetical protein CXG81DRAFT_27868 [Caulochytrium protostelioides]
MAHRLYQSRLSFAASPSPSRSPPAKTEPSRRPRAPRQSPSSPPPQLKPEPEPKPTRPAACAGHGLTLPPGPARKPETDRRAGWSAGAVSIKPDPDGFADKVAAAAADPWAVWNGAGAETDTASDAETGPSFSTTPPEPPPPLGRAAEGYGGGSGDDEDGDSAVVVVPGRFAASEPPIDDTVARACGFGMSDDSDDDGDGGGPGSPLVAFHRSGRAAARVAAGSDDDDEVDDAAGALRVIDPSRRHRSAALRRPASLKAGTAMVSEASDANGDSIREAASEASDTAESILSAHSSDQPLSADRRDYLQERRKATVRKLSALRRKRSQRDGARRPTAVSSSDSESTSEFGGVRRVRRLPTDSTDSDSDSDAASGRAGIVILRPDQLDNALDDGFIVSDNEIESPAEASDGTPDDEDEDGASDAWPSSGAGDRMLLEKAVARRAWLARAGDSDGDDFDDPMARTRDARQLAVMRDVPTAFNAQFHNPAEHYVIYSQWLVHLVFDPLFGVRIKDADPATYSYFASSIRALDTRVQSYKQSLVGSSVWTREFEIDVGRWPVIRSQRRGIWDPKDCDVCRRHGHVASWTVGFTGRPYDHKTLAPVLSDRESYGDMHAAFDVDALVTQMAHEASCASASASGSDASGLDSTTESASDSEAAATAKPELSCRSEAESDEDQLLKRTPSRRPTLVILDSDEEEGGGAHESRKPPLPPSGDAIVAPVPKRRRRRKGPQLPEPGPGLGRSLPRHKRLRKDGAEDPEVRAERKQAERLQRLRAHVQAVSFGHQIYREYDAGRMCYERLSLWHRLHHWQYTDLQTVTVMVREHLRKTKAKTKTTTTAKTMTPFDAGYSSHHADGDEDAAAPRSSYSGFEPPLGMAALMEDVNPDDVWQALQRTAIPDLYARWKGLLEQSERYTTDGKLQNTC